MRILKNFAAAAILGALAAIPASARAPSVTVKEYPLNFEAGGSSAPITLYRHQGELAFVVIDSIDAKDAYRLTIGGIAQYGGGGKALPMGAYLPLRNGEAVTLRLARNGTLKLKAHVMVVTGYGA